MGKREAQPMDAPLHSDCRSSYDQVAEDYVRHVFDELWHKPLDRHLLDRFAADVRDVGLACDMGCGPGHVARYLHAQGIPICGIDLSPQMVEQAHRLTPDVAFRQGDMTALDAPDGAWAGIVAFYSLIHISPGDMTQTLVELRRVLRPDGLLLLAFHIGDEVLHLDTWWERAVSVDFFFYRPASMAAYLEAAGFAVEEVVERAPYPDVEYQGRRAYIFARRADPV